MELNEPPPPTRTIVGKYRWPVRITNCGVGAKHFGRNTTAKSTEEEKREEEEFERTLKTSDTSISATGSYGSLVSATASEKATASVEHTRRHYLMQRRQLDESLELKDEIDLPEHSFVNETVNETDIKEAYEVPGVVTTDALLSMQLAITVYIGHWSDVADEKARQFPIVGKYSVVVRDFVYHHDIQPFKSENECLAAAGKEEGELPQEKGN